MLLRRRSGAVSGRGDGGTDDATSRAVTGAVEIRSHAPTQRRSKGLETASKTAKVPLKKTGRATDKQRARGRDSRALQLASANAQAEAGRIAEERRGWVRAATDLRSLLRLQQVRTCRLSRCGCMSRHVGDKRQGLRCLLRELPV